VAVPDPLQSLERAVEALRHGGVVVYPTETLYGLGVDATDEAALLRLVALKGREPGKPISVLVSDRDMLRRVAEVTPAASRLMDCFWPGPLTLTLPARAGVSPLLLGGGSTIGVRCSSHPLAGALVAGLGRPVTSPSANPAGMPPPVTLAHARAYFREAVDVYLDGGELPGGVGSTVVDPGPPLKLIREGAIAVAAVVAALEQES
jgi:L-threonylcarbamoyladenylate synthase